MRADSPIFNRIPGVLAPEGWMVPVTVEELLADLVKDYEANQRASLPTVRSHVKPPRVAFGDDRAIDVTTPRVRRVQKARQDAGVTNPTINRRIEMLRRTFNLAKQAEKITTVPHFPRLIENAPPGKYMSPDAFEVIHRHLAGYLKDFFELACWLGIRKGQLE